MGLAAPVSQPEVRVAPVEVTDDDALRAWYAGYAAAFRADLEHPVVRSWPHLRDSVHHPWDYYGRTLLAAVAGTEVVGVAELGRDLVDNTHLADLTIAVPPEHRRRGIGSLLYRHLARLCRAHGVTTVVGEAYDTATWRGAVDFAQALGFASAHVERHLRLTLPVPAEQHAALRAAAGADDGYRIRTWTDGCPADLVEEYARLQTQMLADMPLGEVDYAPPVVDVHRVRTLEAHTARTHHQVVAAAERLSDGRLAGYSVLYLDRHDQDVLQDDTLVMPADRGRRLGLRLKLATLEVVERDFPQRRAVHTWTALDNHAMLRTNTAFGFEPVATMHEMQRAVDPGS